MSFFDIFQIQEVHFGTFEVHFGSFAVHFGSFEVHFGSLLVISRPSFFEEMGFVPPRRAPLGGGSRFGAWWPAASLLVAHLAREPSPGCVAQGPCMWLVPASSRLKKNASEAF